MAINLTKATAASSVVLTPGQTYTVGQSNLSIQGGTGVETVVIPGGYSNTQISSTVENVQLSGGLFSNSFFTSAGQFLVYGPAYNLVASIAPSTSGTHLKFSDGSAFTVTTNSAGAVGIHYDKVQLLPNMGGVVPNSDIAISGSTGFESLTIPASVNHVSLDPSVDAVKFQSRPYDASLLRASGSVLSFSDPGGQHVADLSLSPGSSETLYFSNAIGVASLGAGGQGTFTLTDLLLSNNQAYSATQSNLKIYGAPGQESVSIASGVANETIDPNIEQVTLPNKYSSYSWKTGSGQVLLYNSSTLVADIFVPQGPTGTQIKFADATYVATYQAGVVSLVNTNAGASGTTSTAPATTGSLKYTADYGSFGSYLGGVQACLNSAIGRLASVISAKGSLDLQVIPESVASNVLAEASGATVRTGPATASTEFQLESKSGSDANGSAYDASVYINMSNIGKFNLDPTKLPTSSQYDLTTVLEHEILHALGFTGTIGTSSGPSSPFDQLVSFVNGKPYFVGANAQKAYGGPVPLAPASAGPGSAYYHVNIAGDLMNDSMAAGQVHNVSAVDVAILQDIGVPTLVGVVGLA